MRATSTILISDSNVRVGSDYLRALAGELSDPEVGMVHSVLVGQGGDTLGALLENLQMNTITAYGASGMELFSGLPLVIGKSMLLKLSHLEEVGGFLGVANLLAEDYVLGRRFHDAGHKVRLSPYRIGVVNAGWGNFAASSIASCAGARCGATSRPFRITASH